MTRETPPFSVERKIYGKKKEEENEEKGVCVAPFNQQGLLLLYCSGPVFLFGVQDKTWTVLYTYKTLCERVALPNSRKLANVCDKVSRKSAARWIYDLFPAWACSCPYLHFSAELSACRWFYSAEWINKKKKKLFCLGLFSSWERKRETRLEWKRSPPGQILWRATCERKENLMPQ